MSHIVILIVGLAAGLLSGTFGIGGGLVVVPGLMLLAGFAFPAAAGTSLAALAVPLGVWLAAYEYARQGHVDLVAAALVAGGLAVGAYLGARLGLTLPAELVQRAFGLLLLGLGVRYLVFVG